MATIPDTWYKYDWPLKDSTPVPSGADYSEENLAQLIQSFAQILGVDSSQVGLYYENNTHANRTDDILVRWNGDDPPCTTITRPLKPGTPLFRYEKYAKRSVILKRFQDNSPAHIQYFKPFNSCDPSDPTGGVVGRTYSVIAKGGVIISGAIGLYVYESTGEAIVGGTADISLLLSPSSSGGILLTGESETVLKLLGMEGGAIVGGEAIAALVRAVNEEGDGGVIINGLAKTQVQTNRSVSGGCLASGTASAITLYGGINGGVLLGGTSLIELIPISNITSSGGVTVSGAAYEELIGADMVNARDVIYSPDGFVARDVEAKLLENVSVKDFGATGLDSQTDATTYIQNAINYAAQTSNFNKTINFPNGIYNILGTITVPQGIYLKGEGSQGSTVRYGTVIKHKSNANCIEFTGSGDASAGTGGGLENFLIVKANSGSTQFTGGSAILIEAQSTTNRPGEMLITNVLIYGADTSYWSRCIEVDGTAANTSGTRGVRTINFRKVRVAEASTVNETVLFNQATHIFAHGLAVDQGTGATSESGITIRGETNGVFLNGLDMVGSLIVEANVGGNKCNHLHVDGKIQGKISIQDTQSDGTIRVSGLGAVPGTSVPVLPGALVNKSKQMRITSNYVPYVYATRTANVSDITGGVSGPTYTVAFSTSDVEDVYGNFNGTTFTCTCAGTYQIDYCVTLADLNSNHTRFDGGLVWSNGSSPQYFYKVFNPYAMSASGNLSVNGSHTINMAYGDTVDVRVKVTGNAQVVDLYGSSSQYTWIQIRYIS